jgi:hypothetical protein
MESVLKIDLREPPSRFVLTDDWQIVDDSPVVCSTEAWQLPPLDGTVTLDAVHSSLMEYANLLMMGIPNHMAPETKWGNKTSRDTSVYVPTQILGRTPLLIPSLRVGIETYDNIVPSDGVIWVLRFSVRVEVNPGMHNSPRLANPYGSMRENGTLCKQVVASVINRINGQMSGWGWTLRDKA